MTTVRPMTDEQQQQAREAWTDAQKAPGVLFSHAYGCPRLGQGWARTRSTQCICWVGRMERALWVEP